MHKIFQKFYAQIFRSSESNILQNFDVFLSIPSMLRMLGMIGIDTYQFRDRVISTTDVGDRN